MASTAATGADKAPSPPQPRPVQVDTTTAFCSVCYIVCATCCSGIMCCCSACFKWLGNLPLQQIELILRVSNISNALLLALAAFYTFDDLWGWFYVLAQDLCVKCDATLTPPCAAAFLDIPRVFLGCYIALFSLVLFIFETRTPVTTPFIKRQFGFLFTPSGRAFFMVFLGTVCYGVVGDVINPPTNLQLCILASPAYQVNVTVGTITLVNAVFNTAIIYVHPAYKRDLDAPEGPRVFDPEKLTDGEIKAFLSKHPDIVGAAIAAAQTAQAMAQAKTEYERQGESRASV